MAYPRNEPPRVLRTGITDQTEDGAPADAACAADMVSAALQRLGNQRGESALALKTDSGIQMVVMDPMSVEEVIVEFDNLESAECKDALGRGFLRGMIAKARAAQEEDPNDAAPTLN